MCEDDGHVELEGAGDVAPTLHLVRGEDELPHLGTHHHPHHSLLDKGSRA